MKIIDMRCRPPYGVFLNGLFVQSTDTAFTPKNFAQHFGTDFPASVQQVSLELFFQEMTEAGLSKAVVPMRIQQESDNETVAELLQKYPERFIGMAGINPHSGIKAIETIRHYVTNGPCAGIIIEPGMSTPPLHADDETLHPIYEYCQQENIPVMLSFGGFTSPDVAFHHPIYVDRVASIFPKLKLAMCHGGWPWAAVAAHVAYKNTNVYLSPDMYMINCPGSADYIAAANYLNHDRTLFGSAYPIINMPEAVAFYQKAIRIEVLPKIMYQNGESFLGISL